MSVGSLVFQSFFMIDMATQIIQDTFERIHKFPGGNVCRWFVVNGISVVLCACAQRKSDSTHPKLRVEPPSPFGKKDTPFQVDFQLLSDTGTPTRKSII